MAMMIGGDAAPAIAIAPAALLVEGKIGVDGLVCVFDDVVGGPGRVRPSGVVSDEGLRVEAPVDHDRGRLMVMMVVMIVLGLVVMVRVVICIRAIIIITNTIAIHVASVNVWIRIFIILVATAIIIVKHRLSVLANVLV